MFGRSEKKKPKYNLNRRRDGARGQLLQVSARSGEKSRERTHRISAIVVLVAALAGSCWALIYGTEALGGLLFSQNERFTIQRVDVRSNGRLQPENLREYGKVAEGQNLFAVDLQQIRANLEGVPLIRRAEVSRDLPDTLVIRVTERTALARMADGASGFPVLVDRDGYVLGLARQSTLPLITGVKERGLGPGSVVKETTVLTALEALDVCDTTPLGRAIHIQSMDVRDPDRLNLTLSGGEQIPMGRDQLKIRLEKLAEVLKSAQDMGQSIKTADLTVLRNIPIIYRATAP